MACEKRTPRHHMIRLGLSKPQLNLLSNPSTIETPKIIKVHYNCNKIYLKMNAGKPFFLLRPFPCARSTSGSFFQNFLFSFSAFTLAFPFTLAFFFRVLAPVLGPFLFVVLALFLRLAYVSCRVHDLFPVLYLSLYHLLPGIR